MCIEKMSAGIGATIYNDRDYDMVYYDEELRMIGVMGIGESMEPRYHNGSVALIRETGLSRQGAKFVRWCERADVAGVDSTQPANKSDPYQIPNVREGSPRRQAIRQFYAGRALLSPENKRKPGRA